MYWNVLFIQIVTPIFLNIFPVKQLCITVNDDKALKSTKSFVNLRNMESSWKLLLQKVPKNPSQKAWKVTDSIYVFSKATKTVLKTVVQKSFVRKV